MASHLSTLETRKAIHISQRTSAQSTSLSSFFFFVVSAFLLSKKSLADRAKVFSFAARVYFQKKKKSRSLPESSFSKYDSTVYIVNEVNWV